jgi:ATP-dependent Zn protease
MNHAATAYHEAGHAIAAWRQHISIKSVSIKREVESHGRLIFRDPRMRGAMSEAWAERRIVVALAEHLLAHGELDGDGMLPVLMRLDRLK